MEILVTSPADPGAKGTSSTIVAVADAASAATTAVQLVTGKQESDIVKKLDLSTVEAATKSEPLLMADDATQDFIPVEAELPLAEAEKAGEAIIHAAVPEQDRQVVGAAAPAIASLPETTIVADEPQLKEPTTKEEGGTTIEVDVSHHLQDVDHSFLVSAGLYRFILNPRDAD